MVEIMGFLGDLCAAAIRFFHQLFDRNHTDTGAARSSFGCIQLKAAVRFYPISYGFAIARG